MFVLTRRYCCTKSPFIFMSGAISTRNLATHTKVKEEGDISSVFVSLSGASPPALPERFTDLKRQLVRGKEGQISASWKRLLKQLLIENKLVAEKGSAVVPQIDFNDLSKPSADTLNQIRRRGVAVVRGVIPEQEARGYKDEVEEYVKANPWTKGTMSALLKIRACTLYGNIYSLIQTFWLQLSLPLTHRYLNFTGPHHRSEHDHIGI